jgi:hypothetical protein
MTKNDFDACLGGAMLLAVVATCIGTFGWEVVLYVLAGLATAGAFWWIRDRLPDED